MTPADLAAIHAELAQCRKRIDLALGRAMQLLDQLEAEQRERERDSRLTAAERRSMGAVE